MKPAWPMCQSPLVCAVVGVKDNDPVKECTPASSAGDQCFLYSLPSGCPLDQYCDPGTVPESVSGTCKPRPPTTGLKDMGKFCSEHMQCWSNVCKESLCVVHEPCASEPQG